MFLQHLLDQAAIIGADISFNTKLLSEGWPHISALLTYISNDIAELSKTVKELEDILESEGGYE